MSKACSPYEPPEWSDLKKIIMMIVLGCVVAIDVDKDAGVDGDYGANHTDESHTCKLERDIEI